jgi:predicted Zn-dependent protease with MMP-like domain
MISTRDRELFDDVLDRVIAGLPVRLVELLEEVPLIVEDEPGPALLQEVFGESGGDTGGDSGGGDLCGLHWGTALTDRSVDASAGMGDSAVPDRMMLFRGPIIRLSGFHSTGPGTRRNRGLSELRKQVKITLLHEIGHHFGLDEDDLDQLGYA